MRSTIEWTLHNDAASISCTARETSHGIELFVTCAGLPLARRVTPSASDAEEQANAIRAAWEAAGWAADATLA